ncbi:MAG: hypothetical protein V4610_00810 [Pseudomonadota bacterium]|jgi:hypothetical protein|uniref:DUF6916 domain-containing protein n=1 Tax=hydrothermal vent metagenome TaxID=652676 RepID=A0A160TIM8_9ZZZZ
MLDRMLTYEEFEPHVGTDFTVVHAGDTPIILNLLEATALKKFGGEDSRAPFGLLFQSSYQDVIPQQLFTLQHDAMGKLGIFLVPTAQNATGTQYYATFN